MMIMEDATEQTRPTSQIKPHDDQITVDSPIAGRATSAGTQQISGQMQPPPMSGDNVSNVQESESMFLDDRMNTMQTALEQKFQTITGQIQDGQSKQNRMVSSAGTLVDSLKDALQAL